MAQTLAGSSLHCQTFLGYVGWALYWFQPTPQGDKVCNPLELSLADLHGAHQGIDRMQAQVREAVYWPSIDTDIADYVHQCTICTKHKTSPAQPMLPRGVPDGPWQEIMADYFTHKDKEYLLICDQFSKYPFLYKVSTKSTQSYVHASWRSYCSMAHHSCSYRQWATLCVWGTHTILTVSPHRTLHFSPHFPRSNGFIECQVQTLKTALSTGQGSHKTLEDVLLDLQSTLIGPNMPSPHEILHNRMFQCLSKPSQPVDMESVRNYLLSHRQSQKTYFDRAHGVHGLTELGPGQELLFRSLVENEYIPGTIVRWATMQHSYIMEA